MIDSATATAGNAAVPPVELADATAGAITPQIDTVAALVPSVDIPIPPVQLGDMAALGLVHYTPAGFLTWLLECTHVFTGMPWWGTIILVTGMARASIFPLVVRGARTAAKLAVLQPEVKKLQADMMLARARNDNTLFARAVLKQRTIFREHGVSPLTAVYTSVAQIVVQLGFFFGLRRMCEFPVEQLKTGGFGFITDLTIPDPYYVLPIANILVMNLQLSVRQLIY